MASKRGEIDAQIIGETRVTPDIGRGEEGRGPQRRSTCQLVARVSYPGARDPHRSSAKGVLQERANYRRPNRSSTGLDRKW